MGEEGGWGVWDSRREGRGVRKDWTDPAEDRRGTKWKWTIEEKGSAEETLDDAASKPNPGQRSPDHRRSDYPRLYPNVKKYGHLHYISKDWLQHLVKKKLRETYVDYVFDFWTKKRSHSHMVVIEVIVWEATRT